jgi:hypothetical protein
MPEVPHHQHIRSAVQGQQDRRGPGRTNPSRCRRKPSNPDIVDPSQHPVRGVEEEEEQHHQARYQPIRFYQVVKPSRIGTALKRNKARLVIRDSKKTHT